ncbi:MAG: transaldolase [Trueperaceae bacterium]|nr:transaldolase [Trueperaceae bacterium]
MHLYLDSADAADLGRVLPSPLVAGVTTNPTLMRRAGLGWGDLPDLLRRLLDLGVFTAHVQVRHADAEGMLRDARGYLSLANGLTVITKLPATRAGFAAARALTSEGAPVTMTAVVEPEQVLWSALVGARYAAPYLGRMDESGRDGLAVVGAMQAVAQAYGDGHDPALRLLVASIRSREAFRDLLRLGVGAVTVPVPLFEALTEHEATLAAERTFLADAS